MSHHLNRRNFLKSAASLAAACSVAPRVFAPADLYAFQAPSDRLRMGCIGLGGQGRGNARGFNGMCDIVALCDVDESFGIARAIKENIGKNPDTYKDYRRVLERDDIDVVCIGTPDHWHVKIAIEAMQSGKHVFCEKPLTLTLAENLLVRKATEKYGKIFQVGTQQRAQKDQFMLAAFMVRKGYLGEIENIICDIGGSPSSGEIPVMDVPDGFDWDFWLGQAPYVEFRGQRNGFDDNGNRNGFGQTRAHNDFRWWYEYSGGKFTDWGAHHIDCALWALELQEKGTGPVSFDGTGAVHPVEYKDGYPTVANRFNTSTKFDVLCKFANGVTMHVASGSPDGNGILFEGTKGRIHVNRSRIKGKPFEELPEGVWTNEEFSVLYNGKPYEGHKPNFFRCIREGGLPVSDVFSHVQAMHCCHLSAIASRLDREVKWDPQAEQIVGDAQAAAFFSREARKGYELPTVE